MDPGTIFQIVSSAISVGEVVLKCINRLGLLKAKYHNAPLIISTLIGQLYIIQAALDQLSAWKSGHLDQDPRYRHLASQINNSFDCFRPLMIALQQKLDRSGIQEVGQLKVKETILFLWNEGEMNDYVTLLNHQANALNLLLQAVQCNTWAQQDNIIGREENRSILKLAQDCSTSLVGHDDTSSFTSESTAALSKTFDFDSIVLGSRLYQEAQRSHLRQAIRAVKYPRRKRSSTEVPRNSTNPSPADIILEESVEVRSSVIQSRRTQVSPTNDINQMVTPSQSTKKGRDSHRLRRHIDAPAFDSSPRRSGSIESGWQLGISRLGNWWKSTETPSTHTNHNPRDILTGHQKVLLLGTSESGKTTLLKALKLAREGDYTKDERRWFREILWNDTVCSVFSILEAMKALGLPFENETNRMYAEKVYDDYQKRTSHMNEEYSIGSAADYRITTEISHAIVSLWADRGFQIAHRRRREFQFPDNAEYYIGAVERIAGDDYVPSNQDILRSRLKTVKITETPFNVEDHTYVIYDVGGSRSQRKKWVHIFENVSTILFTIDVTAYERLLFEDETVNRMHEQLVLFDSIANSRWFSQTQFLIVLTKMDLLEKCLPENSVEYIFTDFLDASSEDTGICYLERYMCYLERRFMDLIGNEEIRKRTRTVRANLVDVDLYNPATEIWEILEQTAFT
ncbi:G-alpha-domain-containing protein [Whalleya microplaca]|nr:G-alpha-domain-containing protein [Whalleya microplaca]